MVTKARAVCTIKQTDAKNITDILITESEVFYFPRVKFYPERVFSRGVKITF